MKMMRNTLGLLLVIALVMGACPVQTQAAAIKLNKTKEIVRGKWMTTTTCLLTELSIIA